MRTFVVLLVVGLTLPCMQANASVPEFCANREGNQQDTFAGTLHEIRVGAELKRNFGAAIDPTFAKRSPEEINVLSETIVGDLLTDLGQVGTFPLWTNEPPFFGMATEDGGFTVFIGNQGDSSILFRSERLMHQSELSFILDYFLTRSLGDCRAALGDPEFASLHYKIATIVLAHWCAGDGQWYKSEICGEEALKTEIVRFNTAHQAVKEQAVSLAGRMSAQQANYTDLYLSEWSEHLASLKRSWCDAHGSAESFCGN